MTQRDRMGRKVGGRFIIFEFKLLITMLLLKHTYLLEQLGWVWGIFMRELSPMLNIHY